MVYSTDDQWAQDRGYDDLDDYTDSGNSTPTSTQLGRYRSKANSNINKWIGCRTTDITDTVYTTYLKELELEVIERIRDKEINRRSNMDRNIFQPHDYLYKDEREELKRIGIEKGYILVGKVG